MAGFGQAFANSYNQAEAIEAKQQDSLFSDMMKKMDSYSKEKSEKDKYVSLAKDLATQAGNEGAWRDFYQQMATGGVSYDSLRKEVADGQWVIQGSKAEPLDLNQETDQALKLPETPQEAQLGTPKGTPEEQLQTAPQAPVKAPGGILTNVQDWMSNFQQRKAERQTNKALGRMENQGYNREQVTQAMQGGYNPDGLNGLAEATASFRGKQNSKDPTLNPETELQILSTIETKLGKEINGWTESKNTLNSLEQDVREVMTVAGQNEEALSEAANVAQGVVRVKEFSEGLVKLFTGHTTPAKDTSTQVATFVENNKDQNGNVSPDVLQKAATTLEQEIQNMETGVYGNIAETANARTLLEMKWSLMAYKLGIMYQQSGRSFAEAERKLFTDIFSGANNIEKLNTRMESLFRSEVDNLEAKRKTLYNNRLLDYYRNYMKQDFNEELATPVTMPSDMFAGSDGGNTLNPGLRTQDATQQPTNRQYTGQWSENGKRLYIEDGQLYEEE